MEAGTESNVIIINTPKKLKPMTRREQQFQDSEEIIIIIGKIVILAVLLWLAWNLIAS